MNAPLTQKWAIVSLLTEVAVGYEYDFKNWPLHITLADVFATSWDGERLSQQLQKFAAHQPAVTVTMADVTHLGETKVLLIEPSVHLRRLHDDLGRLLAPGNVSFNHPEFTGDGFLPHSTVQAGPKLAPGQTITLDNIALIDMFPGGNGYRRQIRSSVQFLP